MVDGSTVRQLEPIDADDELRAACEFDAERSELFLSRATILVEGLTEKVGFPYVFAALGHDADREAISVVECDGKANIPLFVEICAGRSAIRRRSRQRRKERRKTVAW